MNLTAEELAELRELAQTDLAAYVKRLAELRKDLDADSD